MKIGMRKLLRICASIVVIFFRRKPIWSKSIHIRYYLI